MSDGQRPRPRAEWGHTDPHDLKVCVLGVWQESVVWPVLWAFAPESFDETKLGKKVIAAAEWISVEPPKIHEGRIRDRAVVGFGYLQETEAAAALETLNMGPPPLPLPERELAVYAGAHFALLLPSELMEIVLSKLDAWQQDNREQLLMALRHCEGNT